MSRKLDRLKDWPDCLKKKSLAELRAEGSYWQSALSYLRHPQAKKNVAKKIRQIQQELDSRDDE